MRNRKIRSSRLASISVWLALVAVIGGTFVSLMLILPLLALSNGAAPIWALLVGMFALVMAEALVAGRWAIPLAKRLWRATILN